MILTPFKLEDFTKKWSLGLDGLNTAVHLEADNKNVDFDTEREKMLQMQSVNT